MNVAQQIPSPRRGQEFHFLSGLTRVLVTDHGAEIESADGRIQVLPVGSSVSVARDAERFKKHSVLSVMFWKWVKSKERTKPFQRWEVRSPKAAPPSPIEESVEAVMRQVIADAASVFPFVTGANSDQPRRPHYKVVSPATMDLRPQLQALRATESNRQMKVPTYFPAS